MFLYNGPIQQNRNTHEMVFKYSSNICLYLGLVIFLCVYPVKYCKSATTTTNIVFNRQILTLNSTSCLIIHMCTISYPWMLQLLYMLRSISRHILDGLFISLNFQTETMTLPLHSNSSTVKQLTKEFQWVLLNNFPCLFFCYLHNLFIIFSTLFYTPFVS